MFFYSGTWPRMIRVSLDVGITFAIFPILGKVISFPYWASRSGWHWKEQRLVKGERVTQRHIMSHTWKEWADILRLHEFGGVHVCPSLKNLASCPRSWPFLAHTPMFIHFPSFSPYSPSGMAAWWGKSHTWPLLEGDQRHWQGISGRNLSPDGAVRRHGRHRSFRPVTFQRKNDVADAVPCHVAWLEVAWSCPEFLQDYLSMIARWFLDGFGSCSSTKGSINGMVCCLYLPRQRN